MENSITLRLPEILNEITYPLKSLNQTIQKSHSEFNAQDLIGGCSLVAPLAVTKMSEVWYAEDYLGETCVVKLIREVRNSDLIEQIRLIDCPNLMKIYDCGYEQGVWYEVYPYYKNGTLKDYCQEIVKGSLDEAFIKEVVLPGLQQAIAQLHQRNILHNDIKPNNIFMTDNFDQIVLGDYGCVCENGGRPQGYTPAYASPETLTNNKLNKGADWFSVGITLGVISETIQVNEDASQNQAINAIERGITCYSGSSRFKQLVNGLLQTDLKRRLGPRAVEKWLGDKKFGGIEVDARIEKKSPAPLTIQYSSPDWIAADIQTLLSGIETHWNHSVFLFSETHFDRFLGQFDPKWKELCQSLRRSKRDEDALFCLTLELTDHESFIWRGLRCRTLTDMEELMNHGPNRQQDVVDFLQKALVIYYLRVKGARLEQIEFAKRLEEESRINPVEACEQLFSALRGNDGVVIDNYRLEKLDDLADYLALHIENLDEVVSSLMNNRRFSSWFSYQGMEEALNNIRRKISYE